MGVGALVVLMLWVWPGPGLAFFPDAEQVRTKVQEQLGSLESLQLEISFPGDDSLTLFLWQQGSDWRQEWVQDREDGQTVVGAGIGTGSALLASYPRVQQFPQPVLNFWFQPPLQGWLQELGIDTSVKSYQFLETRPCLVFGARYGESNRAQLWIDNELHLPRKLTTWKGVVWTWSDYFRVGNFFLPHRAQVQFPFGTSVEMRLDWRGVNRDIPDELFRSRTFARKFSSAGFPEVDSRVYEIFFTQVPPALPQ
jgi:hypothetical protein